MERSTAGITFFFFFSAVLFLSPSPLPGESLRTASSDVEALKAFKSSINTSTIASYSCLGSWNFTAADPCSLPRLTSFLCGLTCSGNRVTRLELDEYGYSGTLSPAISKLTSLVSLNLHNNRFYGSIPAALFSLPNLQELVLGANSFSGWVPPSITWVKSLQVVDLSYNSLSGSLPVSLNSLSRLTKLDLSFNRLTGPIPPLPPTLIEIAMKSNCLSGQLQKSSFNGSTQLEVIELSNNSLTGALESWLFRLPALQQINLSNNRFTTIAVERPEENNSDLVAVDLGYNSIGGKLPENFGYYPSLSSLTLRYNRLRGIIPLQYGKQRSLRRLFLDGNYLKGRPPADLFSPFFHTIKIAGSLGDNCLQGCPRNSELCSKPQKRPSLCRYV